MSEPRDEGGVDDDLAVTAIEVIEKAHHLDRTRGRVLVEVLRLGQATINDLLSSLDLPEDDIRRAVTELKLEGYLTTLYEADATFYSISDSWGTEDFPSGPVIPLVYQYNLLSDQQRLSALKEAIDSVIEPGDIVADLGAGVGALSFLASKTAEKVYAIEIDQEVFEEGRKMMQKNGIDNVEYINSDARTVSLPEPADVVLCEMLDTALIAELQVPVMNYAVESLLADDGTVVPSTAQTTMTAVETDYEFYGGEFRLPHFEEYGSRPSVEKSQEVMYHEVSFNQENDEVVDETVVLSADEHGVINGIQLNTDVQFTPAGEFVGASPWLDPPLTLPLQDPIDATPGKEFTVDITYRLGGGLSDIRYEVIDR